MNIAKNILEKRAFDEIDWKGTQRRIQNALKFNNQEPNFIGKTWEGLKELPEELLSGWKAPTALAGGTLGIGGLTHTLTSKWKELGKLKDVKDYIQNLAESDARNRVFSTLGGKVNTNIPRKALTYKKLLDRNKRVLNRGSNTFSAKGTRSWFPFLGEHSSKLIKPRYRDTFFNRHQFNALKYPKLKGGSRAGFLTPAIIASLLLSNRIGSKGYK